MTALGHTYGLGVCGTYGGVSPLCPFPRAPLDHLEGIPIVTGLRLVETQILSLQERLQTNIIPVRGEQTCKSGQIVGAKNVQIQ